ncbi:MAG TPA: hypothetical protein VIL88_02555 [Devosia sp.]|jgi:hypothetical protein|uniref:hypothetical protein n=1 Tax=Devosia sp. TaxID=1871048 RepID=UPI002F91EA28
MREIGTPDIGVRTLTAARPRLVTEIVRTISARQMSVSDVRAVYPSFDRKVLHMLRAANAAGCVPERSVSGG